MKVSKIIQQYFWVLILATLTFVLPTQAKATSNNNHKSYLTYDKVTDHLSLDIKSVSLKSLMYKISFKTGIEVLFDDKADEPISITLKKLPLKKAIDNILKGRNYSLLFDSDKNGKDLLTGIMILPVGSSNNKNVKRIVNLDKEALQHASNSATLQDNRNDKANERWQKRLDRLPTRFREKIEKRAERKTSRKQEHEKNKKLRQTKIAKREAEHKQRRDEILNSMEPEERLAYEQHGQTERDQMTQQILPLLKNR